MSWHLAAKKPTMRYGYILDSAMFECYVFSFNPDQFLHHMTAPTPRDHTTPSSYSTIKPP